MCKYYVVPSLRQGSHDVECVREFSYQRQDTEAFKAFKIHVNEPLPFVLMKWKTKSMKRFCDFNIYFCNSFKRNKEKNKE